MKPILAICLILGLAGSVAAQPTEPRFSIAAAGGVTNIFHSDFDFSPASWLVSGRVRAADHLAVEGLFHQWQRQEDRAGGSVAYTMRTYAANVLATGTSGAATFSAGGGVGVFDYARDFTQGAFGNTFTSSGVTAQAVAEFAVSVTRRIAIVGRYDLVVPIEDPGFGHNSVCAGVRIGLW